MTQPTNLLILLSDNHHRDLSGAYGHSQARTPNIDRLASTGALLSDAYAASPLCCPSRAAFATGRYPHQTGYWDNAITYDGRVPSWMRRIRDQGHEVTSIGKLHFRATEDDNGFTEELLPMHILGGKGGVSMLLRGFDAEPVNKGQWELYMERSGIGEAPYQAYDRRIADTAIDWLGKHRGKPLEPWVLLVSFPSPHPPFSVPERLYGQFPESEMELPRHWRPEERASHPAIDHLRRTMGTLPMTDEPKMRKIVAGYLGLIAHLDEQIGRVLEALRENGLEDDTRILYTSDHGDLHGELGLLGKSCLYEGSIAVPLVMSGPGIVAGRRVGQITSQVDLFPTIVECVGAALAPEDADLPGISLFPALAGDETERTGFAEYHAAGSKSGMFMLRERNLKLVYLTGMTPQLFDLASPEGEARDLVADGTGLEEAARLEGLLRGICDPEAVDARAKADQRAKTEHWGGFDAVLNEGALVFTPPPGAKAEIEH